MDWLDNMNRALDYIENNLTGSLNYQHAARLARCSEYHFSRMFSFIAGVPLSEYIRRRRLTAAAFDLKQHDIRIAELSKKYGYSSPDAFTRAFQNLHGITPSKAKKERSLLKAYPRMVFKLTIQGVTEMNYRIEEKTSFNIVGIKKRVPIIFEGMNPEIEQMWKSLSSQQMDKLKQLSNIKPSGLIQASTNFSDGRMEEKGELDHYIGVATTKECPDHFKKLEVEPSDWAIFEVVGTFPETLQRTWGRIYSEWFPSSAYEQSKGPEILWNEHNDISSSSFKSEIWIPVKKK